jgi:hypothetical protein
MGPDDHVLEPTPLAAKGTACLPIWPFVEERSFVFLLEESCY